MSTMYRLGGYLSMIMLAGTAGWQMKPDAATPPASAAAARVAPQAMPLDSGPLIVIASDGRATLRVEQQPLEWVLEQIAQQSGWSDVTERARAAAPTTARTAPTAPTTACPDAATDSQQHAAGLLQAIERGDEASRHDGLLRARSEGIAVPDQLLKSLIETDASERVRLLALDSYLEPRTGSAQALRSALEAALYVPNAAVQRVAQQRLAELLDSERIDALVAAQQQSAGR